MTLLPHDYHPQEQAGCSISRRTLLRACGTGLGAIALSDLLATEAAAESSPLAAREPHFPSQAKHVIHLFMNGGPSHVDTFDYKPELNKHDGKSAPGGNLKTERPTGNVLGSPYKFQQYGESGIHVSELFQHTAQHIDDICIVNSMHANVPNHEPSLMLMNTGESLQVRPSMGSWLTYGLGTENQNLPAFVAMCPGGYPIKESQNWQAGFLPGSYQGTYVDSSHTRIDRLIANINNRRISSTDQRRQLDLLQRINAEYGGHWAGQLRLPW